MFGTGLIFVVSGGRGPRPEMMYVCEFPFFRRRICCQWGVEEIVMMDCLFVDVSVYTFGRDEKGGVTN